MAHVLVVNDDPPICELLRQVLEQEAHNVAVAYDGRQGLNKLRAASDHLVVVIDDVMPYMDGYEMLRTVAADAELLTRHAYVWAGWTPSPLAEVRERTGFPPERPLLEVRMLTVVDQLPTVVEKAAQQPGT